MAKPRCELTGAGNAAKARREAQFMTIDPVEFLMRNAVTLQLHQAELRQVFFKAGNCGSLLSR